MRARVVAGADAHVVEQPGGVQDAERLERLLEHDPARAGVVLQPERNLERVIAAGRRADRPRELEREAAAVLGAPAVAVSREATGSASGCIQ